MWGFNEISSARGLREIRDRREIFRNETLEGKTGKRDHGEKVFYEGASHSLQGMEAWAREVDDSVSRGTSVVRGQVGS